MRGFLIRRGGRVAVGVVVTLAITAGLAYATIPDSDGTFHACVASDGSIRMIDPSKSGSAGSCSGSENEVTWNKKGQQGAKGDKGGTGATGPQGPRGAQGADGAKGPKGDPGPAGGPVGPKGDTGPAGPAGPAGPVGPTGATGPKGDDGAAGPAGPKGDTGAAGATGATGATGPKGDAGATGPAGADGAPGPKGDTGAPGPAGGPGPKGDTGAAGPAGATGPAGAQGPKGDTGSTGAQGPQGLKGDPGATGATGAQGLKGDTGATGAQGPPAAVAVGTRRNVTAAPTTALGYMSPALTVNVTSGQAVLVNAQITIGTNNAAVASGLRLWICYQPSGGSLTTAHPLDWIDAQSVQNMLAVYPITDTITGLGTGSYTVGLCGQLNDSTPNNWNTPNWAYTTAEVIAGASILSSANEGPTSRTN